MKSLQPQVASMIKSLSTQDCNDCQGEGYTLAFAGLIEEKPVICLSCNGQGLIDVCSYCTSALSIVNGFEVCNCLVIEQAA